MAYPFKMDKTHWRNRRVPSNKDIIIEWLKLQPNKSLIHSHDIQSNIGSFAKTMYSKLVNPATFDRSWRNIRENGLLGGTGLHIEEIVTSRTEKAWLLTKDM